MHVADVHAGPLAHGLEPLEHGDVVFAVLGLRRSRRSGLFWGRLHRHDQTSRDANFVNERGAVNPGACTMGFINESILDNDTLG